MADNVLLSLVVLGLVFLATIVSGLFAVYSFSRPCLIA